MEWIDRTIKQNKIAFEYEKERDKELDVLFKKYPEIKSRRDCLEEIENKDKTRFSWFLLFVAICFIILLSMSYLDLKNQYQDCQRICRRI